MADYSDAHRVFLQVLSRVRSLDETEAKELMDKCLEEIGKEKEDSLDKFIQELNTQVKPMQLMVTKTTEERDDGDYPCVVLVNQLAGEVTREFSSYSKQELSFVQSLVSEIIALGSGEIEIASALIVATRLPQKVHINVYEKLLKRLCDSKLFIQRKDYTNRCEYISLSGLGVLEMASFLEYSHKDNIGHCFFCTKVTLKGYKCDDCKISLHRDCARKYWDNLGKDDVCPTDKCEGLLHLPDKLLPTSSSSQNKRRKIRRSQVRLDEDEELEEEEVEERNKTNRNHASPRRGRRASRQKNSMIVTSSNSSNNNSDDDHSD